jgi:hypothetical protein
MDKKLNVELTIDEIRILVNALDFHHDGLLDEYDLWDNPIDTAPQDIQDVLPRILALADRFDDLAGPVGKE